MGVYWMVRAGVNAINIEDFLNGEFVGLGWNEIGEFTKYKKVDDIKAALKTYYPSNNNTIGIWAYIIERFGKEVAIGDRILSYYPKYRIYLVGEIISKCLFDEARETQNYRKVKWLGYVKKDELEKQTQNTLGAISSFFWLDHVRSDIEKKFHSGLDFNTTQSALNMATEKKINKERDLHPYLVKYLYESGEFFKMRAKTIYHERSNRNAKGLNEWLHPDIVGVEFSFDKYNESIGEIQRELQTTRATLYSFELKLSLDLASLREYYFQAVSNSSWANYGYLVVGELQNSNEIDEQLKKEIIRLNNLFGIGLIYINSDNLSDSKIIVPAKAKAEIDWDTIDKMKGINKDFEEYLNLISDCLKINKSDQKGWDEVL